MNTQSYVNVCGTYSALLSASEVGLGSILHTFHIPFSGHFLSLNQIFLLSRASFLAGKSASRLIPGSISFIAAALKSLSPAGKKLTPMLAISMQGMLFNVGILLFGHNALGRILGACLSSMWGFLQPILIYYCIFGQALFQTLIQLEASIRAYLPIQVPSIWYFCFFGVALKLVMAGTLAVFATKLSQSKMVEYTMRLQKATLSKKPIQNIAQPQVKKVALLAVKDLFVWPFLACVTLSAISFLWVEGPTASGIVWGVMRPIGIGFLFFFIMRLLPMDKVGSWCEKNKLSGFGQAFHTALSKLRGL